MIPTFLRRYTSSNPVFIKSRMIQASKLMEQVSRNMTTSNRRARGHELRIIQRRQESNRQLNHHLKKLSPSARMSFFYNDLLVNKQADVGVYNLRLRWCVDPQEFIYIANEEMIANGFIPDVDTWTTFIYSFGMNEYINMPIPAELWTLPMHEAYIRMLLVEGRLQDAKTYQHNLLNTSPSPYYNDEHSKSIFINECESWLSDSFRTSRYSRLRTSWMNGFSYSNPKRCIEFYEKLVDNKVVDIMQIKLRLSLCATSASMEQDVFKYILINDLWKNGKIKSMFNHHVGNILTDDNGGGSSIDNRNDAWSQLMDIYVHQLKLEGKLCTSVCFLYVFLLHYSLFILAGELEKTMLFSKWTTNESLYDTTISKTATKNGVDDGRMNDKKKWSKLRTKKLTRLLERGLINEFQLLYRLLKRNNVLDHFHKNIMLQWKASSTIGQTKKMFHMNNYEYNQNINYNNEYSSNERNIRRATLQYTREETSSLKKNFIPSKLDVRTYEALIMDALIMGERDDAMNILNVEMNKYNIDVNPTITKMINMTNNDLNKMRTKRLHSWIQQKDTKRKDVINVFNQMLSNNAIHYIHLLIMLKNVISNGDEGKLLFHKFKNCNNTTTNKKDWKFRKKVLQLICNMYLMEGNTKEFHNMLDMFKMDAKENILHSIYNDDEEEGECKDEIETKRTDLLKSLMNSNTLIDTDRANILYNNMVQNNVARPIDHTLMETTYVGVDGIDDGIEDGIDDGIDDVFDIDGVSSSNNNDSVIDDERTNEFQFHDNSSGDNSVNSVDIVFDEDDEDEMNYFSTASSLASSSPLILLTTILCYSIKNSSISTHDEIRTNMRSTNILVDEIFDMITMGKSYHLQNC
jgi:hypothetical protein